LTDGDLITVLPPLFSEGFEHIYTDEPEKLKDLDE
jgi:hypothetical protein